MIWKNKLCLLLCLLIAGLSMLPAAASASSSDLTKVTVTVKIEKPDYFWQYPFLGKQLTGLTITSFGKTFSIPAMTDADTLEIDVPRGYHARLNIQLQHDEIILQTLSYISKRRVSPNSANFTIMLKAPEPQSISFSSADFESSRP